MIKKLKPNQINFDKYQHCVNTSTQKNWYAQSYVLDFLSPNWELLVLNDYEAVMPIPIKKRFGKKIVAMPLFCQQLGIYSKLDSVDLNEKFFGFLKSHYTVLNYQFNSDNTFVSLKDFRKNYIVPKEDYKVLRKSYFKGRKSTVKTAQYLIYKEDNVIDAFIPFVKKHVKGLTKESDINRLLSYLSFLSKSNQLLISLAYKDMALVSCALWIKEEHQNSLIALINNDEFKKDNGASFVVDAYLQRYSSEKKANLMGGSIRGIEVFFKSFGSQLHEYPVYSNRWLTRILG